MSSSALMSIGVRAMSATYSAMQTTGHNIANANVAGYSRQTVELATAAGQYTGNGFIGKGVDVKTVSRAHDDFLTRAAATAKSLSSMDAARQDRLTQLQQVFQTGENGLGYSMSQFLNSMTDLASRPSDSSTRQVVLARAQDVTTQFNDAATQLDSLQAGVTEDMKTSVTAVNGLAKSIAELNQQIAAVRGVGQPPNDLLDQRDQLINQLSAYVQVSTMTADDGTQSVFIGGGQTLVLGNTASQLQVVGDITDSSRSALALVQGGTTRQLEPSSLGGGSLAGLLRFQNEDLVDGVNLVGQMASALAGAVNKQQMLGVNLQEPLGTVSSKALFATGAPVAVPATTNARNAAGGYASSVTLTVTDPSALQAADYTLQADPAGSGQYVLTRLSTPPVTSMINSGDVVDGMRIDVGSPAPASTDRFLLKPVAQAAGGMTALLQDPRDLAAASPLLATTATTNTGTVQVTGLQMLTAPPQPAATAQITFTNDSGDYSWQLLDASNAVIATGTGTWQAQQPIPTPPVDINGFALTLAGVPRSGDVVSVAPTPVSALASNNGNAVALAALRDAKVVGNTALPGGGTAGGATATDAYAAAMADIGVKVQTAKATATMSAASATSAEQSNSAVAGVNLDEEAARLLQYQQSYQAAAKVLQVAQAIFDTMLQTIGN